MEHKVIKPSEIKGVINAPPSKSMMIRAVAASLLADGISIIRNPAFCEDAIASLSVAQKLGARIEKEQTQVTVKGNGGLKNSPQERILDCKESALCARMFIPIASLREEEIIVTGTGSLLKRPFKMVEELNKFGALCVTKNGYLPARVKGRIKGASVEINGSITSQFLSGLLMSLPAADKDSSITVRNLKSKPYVLLTLELLRLSGVQISFDENLSVFQIKGGQKFGSIDYLVEGDWSSASFFLVAGAIAGSVKVKGLNPDSKQADKKIMEVLKMVGAHVAIDEDGISVEKNQLRAFDFDAEDSPDLVPPLVVLAAFCDGKSRLFGIETLKYKESNRVQALFEAFSSLGVKIVISRGKMEVFGGKIRGGTLDPRSDHRLAMAFAIAGLLSKEGIRIQNPGCVKKSYPDFFTDLGRITR